MALIILACDYQAIRLQVSVSKGSTQHPKSSKHASRPRGSISPEREQILLDHSFRFFFSMGGRRYWDDWEDAARITTTRCARFCSSWEIIRAPPVLHFCRAAAVTQVNV